MKKRTIAYFYLSGVCFLTLGIALTIRAHLGTAPFDAMLVGFYKTFGISVGSWEFILGIFMVLGNAAITKQKPEYPALFTAFAVGSGIDLWLYVVDALFVFEGLFVQIAVFFLGIILSSWGIAIYLQSDFALTPVDRTMLVVQMLTGWSMTVARAVLSLFYLFVALLLGGPIGIGTLLSAFLIGKIIQMMLPYARKIRVKVV